MPRVTLDLSRHFGFLLLHPYCGLGRVYPWRPLADLDCIGQIHAHFFVGYVIHVHLCELLLDYEPRCHYFRASKHFLTEPCLLRALRLSCDYGLSLLLDWDYVISPLDESLLWVYPLLQLWLLGALRLSCDYGLSILLD